MLQMLNLKFNEKFKHHRMAKKRREPAMTINFSLEKHRKKSTIMKRRKRIARRCY